MVEIGIYDGHKWHKFVARHENNTVVVTDWEGNAVSEQWMRDLPTVPSEDGPLAITDDLDTWTNRITASRYSRFGARHVE